MQVMHDRVLIKKIEPDTQTSGGLVLAHVQDETFKAVVLQVGSGKPVKGGNPIPLNVKEGDVVIYNPNATIPLRVDGQDCLVIKEEEIFTIIDSE